MIYRQGHPLFGFKKCGVDVVIDPGALIIGRENIEIGDNVRIDAGVKILAKNGYLKIGSHVHIACNSILSCGGGIEIGDHCGLSFDVKLISVLEDHLDGYLMNPNVPVKYRCPFPEKIVLEKYSTVFAGSTVLAGARLMEGSILGAMSLLRSGLYIDPYTIGVGIDKLRRVGKRPKVETLASAFEEEYAEKNKTPR